MNVIDKALERFPETMRGHWRQVGQAAVHKNCTIGNHAKFLGPAICMGGVFRGGVFCGGVFEDGVFCGGVFRGGVFRGGEFRGGEFEDGEFRDGVFCGGVFRGGVFRGGEFRGGEFRGGEFKKTPLQIFGACNWPVVISQPGRVSVGCQCHTPEYWREHIDGIAKQHGVDSTEKSRVMRCVEIAAQWLIENPDSVAETELLKGASK